MNTQEFNPDNLPTMLNRTEYPLRLITYDVAPTREGFDDMVRLWKHYSTEYSHLIDADYLEFEEDGTVLDYCYEYFADLCSKGGGVKLSFRDGKLTGSGDYFGKTGKVIWTSNIYAIDSTAQGIPFSIKKYGRDWQSAWGKDLILFFNPANSKMCYLQDGRAFYVYPDGGVTHAHPIWGFTEYYDDGCVRLKFEMNYETKQAVVAGDYGSLENAVNMIADESLMEENEKL